MSNFEDFLKSARLVKPSAAMDARVEALFHEAAERRPRLWARPVALWQCAAACVLCSVAGFVVSGLAREPAAVTTHVTERIFYLPNPGPEYRNVFDTRPASEPRHFAAPGAI